MNTKADMTNDIFAEFELHTIEYQVKNPRKQGMGFFITLQSMESDDVQKVVRRIRTVGNKLAARNKTFTADEERANAIEIITAAITGWRWGMGEDGKPGSAGGEQLEFTPVNVKRVLNVDSIRAQLDEQLSDEAQFFRKSN